ncbi:ATP-dependent DNA ligase [Schumannella sp. 10F1B-5-1]|uniref:ATP-dependent DNA ligase n=1 Tax=Schumannella sp. 10F1B-5-1 TaxID=2590780 RepID=UPI00113140E7|nr:ATP-dependent DNA ligase [Schumannella sp. 10F1B-5-1]TPW71763.1 ATP-dependent DNA ligase [Schumannella sp. 10F1B-5-1]
MLAKAVAAVPDADAIAGGYAYEPKWDGFRAIVAVGAGSSGISVEIGSRGSKPLTRYFPELLDAVAAQLPPGTVVDGEIVLRASGGTGTGSGERLDWEALSQRIHPAASRVAKLAAETPASLVVFDLLRTADDPDLHAHPFAERRAALERLLVDARPPLHLSVLGRDADDARRWLDEFEGAGLDGVVAKPLAAPYAPGKRVLLKIKHARTADVVLTGYRMHKSGEGVGSLLLGLYGDDGELHRVGGVSAFTTARRRELIDELAPLVALDAHGEALRGEDDRTRFTGSRDTGFVVLRPERVLEVRYDQMEGARFRHTAQFERWRPDREPRSCTFAQLEVPAAYDLGALLD